VLDRWCQSAAYTSHSKHTAQAVSTQHTAQAVSTQHTAQATGRPSWPWPSTNTAHCKHSTKQVPAQHTAREWGAHPGRGTAHVVVLIPSIGPAQGIKRLHRLDQGLRQVLSCASAVQVLCKCSLGHLPALPAHQSTLLVKIACSLLTHYLSLCLPGSPLHWGMHTSMQHWLMASF